MAIQIKRAYEKAEKKDGYRVLVDRLWPRGVSKAKLHLDNWLKDIAPSPTVRKRFGHKPENWKTFKRDYKNELRSADREEQLKLLAKMAKKKKVTLVYGARDEKFNHATLIKEAVDKL